MAKKPNPKRRNHEVPKGLLKEWASTDQQPPGLHYFDYETDSQQFELGLEAKFAITDWLYVPEISGERDNGLEDWFAIDEDGLAVLARFAAHKEDKIGQKHLGKAMRAAIALGLRNSYLLLHLGVADAAQGGTGDHLAVLRRQTNLIEAKFKQFANWDFMLLRDVPVDLITCERPFADWTLRGEEFQFATMALGPRALLLGTPSSRPTGEMHFAVKDGSENASVANHHNKSVIKTARQWVVAASAAQLNAIAPELSKENVAARKLTDRQVGMPKRKPDGEQ